MIDRFADEFSFLSNFHPSQIVDGGITFPTVEHAFQAAKTMDREQRLAIAALSTPGRAKRAGRKVQLRPDWESVKLTVMEELLEKKFRLPGFTEQLLATGDQELVEGNNWGDRFWGVCKGTGSNHLGLLLMKVRARLREEN